MTICPQHALRHYRSTRDKYMTMHHLYAVSQHIRQPVASVVSLATACVDSSFPLQEDWRAAMKGRVGY